MAVQVGLGFEALALGWVLWTACRPSALGPGRRAWAGSLALLLAADALYEARPAAWPRYPYNALVELAYLAAFAWHIALVVRAARSGGRSPGRVAGPMALALAGGCCLAVLAAEWAFLLSPLWSRGELPLAAFVGASAYAGLHAVACVAAASSLPRVASASGFWLLFGQGCLLAGDFECRFVAQLYADSSAGGGTAGWSLGLCCMAAATCGLRPRTPLLRLVPWRSVQVAVAATTQGLCALSLLLSLACGYLRVERADALAHVTSFAWIAWAGLAALGMRVGRSLRQVASALPAPDLFGLPARRHPARAAAGPRPYEAEVLARAQRALERRVARLARRAQEASAQRRLAALTATWVHELQGPLAALEALVAVHGGAAPLPAQRRLARQALARMRALGRRIMRRGERALARGIGPRERGAGAAPRGVPAATLAAWLRRAVAELRLRPGGDRLRLAAMPAGLGQQAARWQGGRAALCHVVAALVDNALAAAPAGSVRIGWRARARGLELVVADRGPGLSREQRRQFGVGPVQSHKGVRLGLGLWGVLARLEPAGGRLRARARRQGGLLACACLPWARQTRTHPKAGARQSLAGATQPSGARVAKSPVGDGRVT